MWSSGETPGSTAPNYFTVEFHFPPHLLSNTFFLLAHPSFHSCISRESPTDPPVWAVTVRVGLAFPISLQQEAPGQFQTSSIACLIFSSDKITSQATGKLTQTSSIRLKTQSASNSQKLATKAYCPALKHAGQDKQQQKKNITSLEKT